MAIRQNVAEQENLQIAWRYRWQQRYFYGWAVAIPCAALFVHDVGYWSASHSLIGLAVVQIGWVAFHWLEDRNKAREEHQIWLKLFTELRNEYGLQYISSERNRYDTVSIEDPDKFGWAVKVRSGSRGEAI